METDTPQNKIDVSLEDTESILSLTNLHHDLTDRAADTFTLRIDELRIPRGAFVAIQGPSGCGKTTLLTLLGLARRPTRKDDAAPVEQFVLTESPSSARAPLAARPPVPSAPGAMLSRTRVSMPARARYRLFGSMLRRVRRNMAPQGAARASSHATETAHNIAALWHTRPGRRTIEQLRRCLFGFCLQRGELLENLTIYENVELSLRLNGQHNVQQRVRDTLCTLSADGEALWRRRRLLPHGLSGGEYQRVALARAIVHRPQLLLIDEPTANLDPQTARDSLAAVAALQQRFGLTVVMITHDGLLARAFADHLITMHCPARACGEVKSYERKTGDGAWAATEAAWRYIED